MAIVINIQTLQLLTTILSIFPLLTVIPQQQRKLTDIHFLLAQQGQKKDQGELLFGPDAECALFILTTMIVNDAMFDRGISK